MAITKLPDLRFVRECLDYDPATGMFAWRERPRSHFVSDRGWRQWNPKHAGNKAGSRHNGAGGKIYWCIRLQGHLWLAHRIAWLMAYGTDPDSEIDHADGDPLNNRIANLRLATRSEQMANRRLNTKGTQTGVKGVTPNSDRRGFDARIRMNGKTHYLGYFRTIQDAAEARSKAAVRLHGRFARHE